MKRILAGLVAMMVLLTGCGTQAVQQETQQPKKVVAILKAMDSLHWLSVKDGMQKAAKDNNIDLAIFWPESESNVAEQEQMIQDAVISKPDAVILAPCDSVGITKYTEQMKKQKIDVFYIDEEADDNEKIPYVGSDNYASGKMAAETLAKALPSGAQVAVIGGSQNQKAHHKRCSGFQDFIEQHTDLTVVDTAEVPGCTVAGGREAMEHLLQQYPNLQGVFCTSAMMTMGALEQCESQRRSDIKLVGMDTQSDALSAVKDGSLLAMVSQNGYDMGYYMIQTAIEELDGKEVPETTYIKNELITQDNVDTFLKEYVMEGRK